MNQLYTNRLIKIISPINEEVFSIELGGSEQELRELMGAILNVNPASIKGIRDSFGNYHTISSAIKNNQLTMEYSSFYFIVINHNQNNKSMNIKIDKNHLNFNQNINEKKGRSNSTLVNVHDNEKIAFTLFNEDYIDKKKYDILKKMIDEKNEEILTLFKLYNKHGKHIQKLSKQIVPILNDYNLKYHKFEEIKKIPIHNINNTELYINILNTLKYPQQDFDQLKKFILCNNNKVIKAFKQYVISNNKNELKTTLDHIHKDDNVPLIENKFNETNENNKKKKKKKSPSKDFKKIEKIEKELLKILSQQSNFLQDINLIFQADIGKLNNQEKLNLFSNEFKIKDPLNINSESKNLIKEYYNKQIKNKFLKKFNDKELSIYDELIKENDENIIKAYKNFIINRNSEELSKELKKYIEKKVEEREKEIISSSEEEEEEYEESEKDEEEEEEDEHTFTSESMEGSDSESEENEKKSNSEKNNDNYNEDDDNDYIISKSPNKNSNDPAKLLNNNYKINTMRKKQNDELKKDSENINDNKNEDEQKINIVNLKKGEEIKNELKKGKNEHKVNFSNLPGDKRKLNEFIKVINGMAFEENDKSRILQLINEKNEEIMKIFQKFQKNKMSLTKKVLLNLLNSLNSMNRKESSNEDNKIIKNSENDNSNNKKKEKETFESFLKKMENENKLTKQKVSYLLSEFQNGNNMLLSFWEVYIEGKDDAEGLLESLEIFLLKYGGKIQKENNLKPTTFTKDANEGKTPVSIKTFKKDLVNYFKNSERKQTKTKQKKIIDLLIKEHFLSQGSQKFFYEKISNEEKNVTAAFEVFSVTLNHIDFYETLNIIYSNRNENEQNKDNQKGEFLIKLNGILERGNFLENEINVVKEEYEKKNNVLMSILEVYDPDDEEDTIDSIKSFITKIIHSKQN